MKYIGRLVSLLEFSLLFLFRIRSLSTIKAPLVHAYIMFISPSVCVCSGDSFTIVSKGPVYGESHKYVSKKELKVSSPLLHSSRWITAPYPVCKSVPQVGERNSCVSLVRALL